MHSRHWGSCPSTCSTIVRSLLPCWKCKQRWGLASSVAGTASMRQHMLVILLLPLLWLGATPAAAQPPSGFDGWAQNIPEAGSLNQTCDPVWQEAMLTVLYTDTQGPTWTNNTNWLTNTNCTVQDKALGVTAVQLPRYCCWAGVTCCVKNGPCPTNVTAQTNCGCQHVGLVTSLRLNRNNMTGRLPNNLLSWLSCELKTLDVTFNNLSGEIQPSISLLSNLETLGLGYNRFNGSLPASISQMSKLRVLDVTNNQLTGTVPPSLCNDEGISSLSDLLLGNNLFNGNYSIQRCENLVLLDVSNNNITGNLPSFQGYRKLHIARMSNNSLSGTIPVDLNGASWLTDLDVANNQLTGGLPSQLGDMRLLTLIRMNNNSLNGTIPANVFSNLGTLSRLNLANNNLEGSIPPTLNPVPTVTYLDFSNNWLTGVIPDFLKQYAQPGFTVMLQQNFMSCCGEDPYTGQELRDKNQTWQAYQTVNWSRLSNPHALLPDYLAFSSFTVPMETNKGNEYKYMRCPALRVAGPRDDASTLLTWNIDPDYFLYKGCSCELGYKLANKTEDGRLPYFVCEAVADPWYVRNTWALVILILGCTLLPLGLLVLSCYRRGARPAFVQQFYNLSKRVRNEPKPGMVSIVTTDIEGYSAMCTNEPELMGKGVRIHNYCIDKARWQFFGNTLEQEGDSFTIAFHEPFDAVAFCLQAQQLLNRVEWPERLLNQEGFTEKSARKSSMLTAALQGAARMLSGQKSGSATSEVPSPSAATAGSAATSLPSLSSLVGASRTGSGGGSGSDKGKGSRFWRLRRRASAIPEDSTVSATDGSSSQPRSSGSQTGALADLQPARLSDSIDTAGTPSAGLGMNSMATGVTGVTGMTAPVDRRACLFNGLRVRMGIASGKLEKGQSIRQTAMMDRAKMVSDAAGGGQILMDGTTFREVKARLVELGAVDHNGLSLSKMNLSRPTILGMLLGARHRARQADVAVVLDMGQYVHSSLRPSPNSLITCPTTGHTTGTSFHSHATSGRAHTSTLLEQAAQAAIESMEEPLVTSAMAQDGGPQRLHMYQILSPKLSGRAHHFGSNLSLSDDWICVDPPYFNAPGAMSAALGPDGSTHIPAITMVFAAVEGAKDWKVPGDKVKRGAVQRLIRDAIVNTLMAVKTGYMCRMQDDELKYMVAFPEPEDAAKWCLLMQDALLWQDWPEWVLRHEKLREEVDDRGEVVFRGPRMRMGLCHGPPRAIVPDHMGRADYHGASINSAARYMDAAAHGGMVVCEEETAVAIINRWSIKSAELRTVESNRSSNSRNSRPVLPLSQLPLSSSPEGAMLPEHVIISMTPQLSGQPLELGPTIEEVEETDSGGQVVSPTQQQRRQAAPLATPFSSGQHAQVAVHRWPSPASNRGKDRSPGRPRSPILVPKPSPGSPDVETPTLVVQPGGKLRVRSSSHTGASGGSSGGGAVSSAAGGPRQQEPSPPRRSPRSPGRHDPAYTQRSHSEGALPAIKERNSLDAADGVDGDAGDSAEERSKFRSKGSDVVAVTSRGESGALANTGQPAWAERPGIAAGDSASGAVLLVGPKLSGLQDPEDARQSLGVTEAPSGALSYSSSDWPPYNPTQGTAQETPTPRQESMGDGGVAAQVAEQQGGVPVSRSPTRSGTPPITGILKVNESGAVPIPTPGDSTPTGGAKHRKQASVRITLPEGTPDRGSPPAGVPLSSRGDKDKDRERPSSTSNASTITTYRTIVHAYRLGSYRFKGNPEDVPMAQLLMDTHTGRRFPSDPPKGKGNRVKEAAGLLATAFVDFPNVARRYYWLWRNTHDFVRQSNTPTPRISTFKGWAANIISASRTNSMRYHGTTGFGSMMLGSMDVEQALNTGSHSPGSPSAMSQPLAYAAARHTTGGPMHAPSGILSRSKNLLAMMRSVGRRSMGSHPYRSHGLSVMETAPSEINLATVEHELRRNLAGPNNSRGFGSVTAVSPGALLEEQLHPRYRSDSISSFIVAAEEGMLQEQQAAGLHMADDLQQSDSPQSAGGVAEGVAEGVARQTDGKATHKPGSSEQQEAVSSLAQEIQAAN